MRLAAWNCRRSGHRKLAALVEAHQPDVVVMPEWGDHPPVLPPAECSLIGFGETGVRGMAVAGLQGYTVTAADVPPAPWPTVGAVDVAGPHPIRLLAAWANFDPLPDENPVVAAVAAWSEWLTAPGPPVVVAGDFNSGGAWHDQVPAMDHYAVVRALSELGLVSAFHHARGPEQGADEEPTFWMHGHENRPHHVDHVFAAASSVRKVTIGGWAAWSGKGGLSDHAPIVVDLDWTAPTSGPGAPAVEGAPRPV